MRTTPRLISLALIAAVAIWALGPVAVQASQSSKNAWRNIGIGAAALGIYGAVKGNGGLAAAGLAGAGYSAYRYEQDRKHQSQERDRRMYYHHRHRRSR